VVLQCQIKGLLDGDLGHAPGNLTQPLAHHTTN